MNRRDFLNLSVMTATSAALAGCGRPAEPALISQAQMPEFYLPGIAQWYATTCTECAGGCGLGVRVIGGRAKKVEGITQHPLSHGGHCLRAETSLQALYNPDRLRQPWKLQGAEQVPLASWDEAQTAFTASLGKKGLWITGPLSGTIGGLIVAAARASGSKIWVLDFPGSTAQRAAMRSIGEQPRLPWHDIADADYVVNFGGDFLAASHPNNVDYNWQYGQFRSGRERKRRGIMVSFCSRMNLTVSVSDKWVPVKPGSEGLIAAAVAGLLGKGEGKAKVTAQEAATAAGIDADLIHRLAERLKEAKKAVAIGGFENTAYSNGMSSMAAIASLNKALSGGKVETFETDMLVAPKGAKAAAAGDLVISTKQALEGIKSGAFATVWVNDVNPAYLFPQEKLGLADGLKKAETFVFTPFVTETSVLGRWVLATTSMLEQWSDTMVEGPTPVYGIQQPAVVPQAGSKPFGEILLAALTTTKTVTLPASGAAGKAAAGVRDLLSASFEEAAWVRALERGGVYKDASLAWSPYPAAPMFPPTAQPATTAAVPAAAGFWDGMTATAAPAAAPAKFSGKGAYTLIPYPSPVLGDGSITNRPWAIELPDPMAQAVWTTWVEINPETCKALDLKRLDLVEITSESGTVTLPVLPSPAVHPEAVAIPVGMGHTSFGRYAYGKGYNPLNLVVPAFQDGTDEMVWAGTKVALRKTGQNGFGEPGQKGWVTTYDWRAGDMPRHLYED